MISPLPELSAALFAAILHSIWQGCLLALGAPVVAPVGGHVRSVGEDKRRGKFITIAHVYGVESHYYHLSDVSVTAGEPVATGEVLGAVGSSGVSTGPHLHFELREFGQSVSPALYGLVLE